MSIGHQIQAAAEKELIANGEKQLWVWVPESNSRAISFYEKEGYEYIGNASFQMEVNRYENKVMVKAL